jgi:hypothetical protein
VYDIVSAGFESHPQIDHGKIDIQDGSYKMIGFGVLMTECSGSS